MLRTMLKSKIHRVRLTDCNLDYEGSIAIDVDLLRAADILPGEQVQVLNINNGNRIITYAIEAAAGSGTIMLNGPAARAGIPSDILVIITYCQLDDKEIPNHKIRIIKVDSQNKIKQ
ncbi:MAG: aspartate 1-decarboxylase [Planctomycetia bacterium]|nr:aspartate 1-decarboxylase [Planctomycetia bacterium]